MRFLGIQVLRAVAAILVVIHHIAQAPALVHGLPASWLAAAAYFGSGVDLFFVISGFVIWQSIARSGPLTVAGFLRRRWVRILPIYWLSVLLVVVMQVALPRLVGTPFPGVGSLLLSMFLIPQGVLPIVKVGWTLIFENYFYCVFGLLLVLPRKYLGHGLGAWAALTLGLFLANPGAPMLTPRGLVSCPLVFEFVLGAGLAGVCGWLRASPHRTAIHVVAAAAFVGLVPFAVPMVDVQAPNTENVVRFFGYGLPAALLVLVFSLVENKPLEKYFSTGVALGDASYSIYLFHPFLVAVFGRFFSLGPAWLRPADGLAPALCLLGVLLAGRQVYLRIELPLQVRVKALVGAAC